MLAGQTFYHQTIRKTIVAFGNLFSNIKIERQNKTDGAIEQVLQVPLAYAPKEKWLVRLESDPNLSQNTYTSLPRLSFEITGMTYDSTRKVGRMNQIAVNKSDRLQHQFSPVPYNIDISLYALTKTQEDGLTIIEQILPTFTPDFNLSVMMIPELNINQDIPVILNSVNVQDDYDGDFQTRRFVTYTLNFTLKVNLFGNISGQTDIRTVSATLAQTQTEQTLSDYTATVVPVTVIPTQESYSVNENWEDGL